MIDPTKSHYWDGTATKEELQDLAKALYQEVIRCHKRLEIDAYFVVRDLYDSGSDWKGVKVEVPWSDREHTIDGITCRDETIRLMGKK